MDSKYQQFKDLHHSPGLFVLPNVWNAKTALLFQEQQFPAIATSSMAVAHSLGYEDGEAMPFNDYLFIINRILASVQIPLSVDIEMGYGATDKVIYDNILRLIDMGVAGINIEDSVIDGSVRTLQHAQSFARRIDDIKNKLAASQRNIFINIRCDTFILDVENKLEETLRRIKLYEPTGADGIFLPCITAGEDIAAVVHDTKLPLNVMCMPGLPGFKTLNELGVKRASMGGFLFHKIYGDAGALSRAIISQENFSPILS